MANKDTSQKVRIGQIMKKPPRLSLVLNLERRGRRTIGLMRLKRAKQSTNTFWGATTGGL